MAEEVGTLVWREARDKIAEFVPECLNGSQCLGAQESFEFGKGLLNRVQVGTVGWQVKQSCAGSFNRLADPGDLVGTEIVHDDDVATCQRGNQHLLDIGQERLAVDRSRRKAGVLLGLTEARQVGRGHAFPRSLKKRLCDAVELGGGGTCEITTSFLQLRLDVREPALVAGFGISGCWVGGLLRESPQAARRRQPVTRHRVAGSREMVARADTP
jgi:hypothetical protein